MKTRLLALCALTAAVSLTAACGSEGGHTTSPVAANETATDMTTETPTAEASPSEPGTASPSPSVSASPFGPACASLPTAATAGQPLGTALASIPSLSTLTKAVKKAGLLETLNSAQDITVFAPTNAAFDKLGKNKLDKIMADKKSLTNLLGYHVVKGRKTPSDLKSGRLTSLQGGDLTTSGSGTTFKVNDASVVCGDLPTTNATVYVIDKVLMPK